MKKRLLSGLLALCMVLSLLPGTALADDGIASGTCGENLTWTLENGTLTISGSGAMFDYNINSAPWYSRRGSITAVRLGDGVTSIGQYAFYYCTSLTSVTIPNSVTSIGGSAFYHCTSLTSVSIPDSVSSIGGHAFYNCTSLTSVSIPNSVTSIGWSAFEGCTSLTSVTIPSSVTDIGWNAFRGTPWLKTLGVFAIANGILFAYQGAGGDITIPSSVTSIGDYAFSDCTSLTSVDIPSSVTNVKGGMFNGCTSLTSVSIPSSVTSIGSSAFKGCTSLTSVTIPSGVTQINSRTFEGCTSLTNVTIPSSVDLISDNAFYQCISLTDVYYGGTWAQWLAITVAAIGNEPLTNATIHYGTEPQPEPGILALSPVNGAMDVAYQGLQSFSITFDRAIKSLEGHEFRPGIDLTNDVPFAIYRASDDQLIYRCSSNYDFLLNADKTKMTLEISSTTNLASPFEPNTQYYIVMGEGFVNFQDGTVSPAIAKGQWTFTTAEKQASSDSEITVPISAGGNTLNVKWDDEWFNDIPIYNHDLAVTSAALSWAAYDKDNIKNALIAFGFDGDKIKQGNYDETEIGVAGYTLASKPISTSDGDYVLVAVIVRGSANTSNWLTDFLEPV